MKSEYDSLFVRLCHKFIKKKKKKKKGLFEQTKPHKLGCLIFLLIFYHLSLLEYPINEASLTWEWVNSLCQISPTGLHYLSKCKLVAK